MKLGTILKTILAMAIVASTTLLIAFLAQKRTSPDPIELSDLIPEHMRSDGGVTMPFYSIIGDKDRDDESPKAQRFEQYTVELKRFTRQPQAEAFIDKLAKQNIDAYFTPVMSDDRVYYIVRTGVFSDESAAKQYAGKMKTAQKVDSVVVRLQ